MKKMNVFAVVAAAALFASTGAFAATLQPAAGEAPFEDATVAATAPSSLTRTAVEAQAARALPAAGEGPVARAGATTSAAHATNEVSLATNAQSIMPSSGEGFYTY